MGYTAGMTVDTLIMLSGAFVALLPFLGLPNSWDEVLFTIAGIVVIALGITVRRRGQRLVVHKPQRAAHVIERTPQRAPEPVTSASQPEEAEHENA